MSELTHRFELRINPHHHGAPVAPAIIVGRQLAEECLVSFAKGAGLTVHLHPGTYSDSSVSTAYAMGGDSFRDAVAVLRRRFDLEPLQRLTWYRDGQLQSKTGEGHALLDWANEYLVPRGVAFGIGPAEAPAAAGGSAIEDALRRALLVLVLNPHHRRYLAGVDPKGLEQATAALRLAGAPDAPEPDAPELPAPSSRPRTWKPRNLSRSRDAVYFLAPKRTGGWRVVKVLEHGPYHDRRPASWVGPYGSSYDAQRRASLGVDLQAPAKGGGR